MEKNRVLFAHVLVPFIAVRIGVQGEKNKVPFNTRTVANFSLMWWTDGVGKYKVLFAHEQDPTKAFKS